MFPRFQKSYRDTSTLLIVIFFSNNDIYIYNARGIQNGFIFVRQY